MALVVVVFFLLAYPTVDYLIIDPSPMPFLRLKLWGVDRVQIGWSRDGKGMTTVLRGDEAREFIEAIDAERGIRTPGGIPIYGIAFYRKHREIARMWMEGADCLNWGRTRWASGMYLTQDSSLRIRKVFERHGIPTRYWDDPAFNGFLVKPD